MKLNQTLVGFLGLALLVFAVRTHAMTDPPDARDLASRPARLVPQAVTFTDISAGLLGLHAGAVAWGDYDNDGDLDIAIEGNNGASPFTKIYRNDGGGTFTDIAAGLTAVFNGSLSWGDYDNDEDLDLLLTGVNGVGSSFSGIYRNDGGGVFTLIVGPALPAVSYSSAEWGDYDNDGDLDILLTGHLDAPADSGISRVYRNDGGGTFTNIGAGLPSAYRGSVAWGDYDNDGDLDVLLTGQTNAPPWTTTRVYRNDGDGTFADAGVPLLQLMWGKVAWGDCDNDGDPDILLTGWDGGSGFFARVYRNNGDGTFTDMNVSLPGVFFGSAAWGDYDNDGDLDLVLTGDRGSGLGYISRVYRNDGGWVFTDLGAGLPGLNQSSVAWGDYDNDGDLDLLMMGQPTSPAPFGSFVFGNNGAPANTPPLAPTGLSKLAMGDSVTFSWNASSDGQTPAAGLTYNLRVGSAPGMSDIVSPMSNLATGWRRVVQKGNTQERTSWTVKMPHSGTYYWSVQTVDGAFAGSPFATEDNVVPVLASLATVDARSDGVRIRWYAADPSALSATVYRSKAGTGWVSLAQLFPDGSGFISYEDTTVEPGARYGYRLGILRDSGEVFAGETWVEVPAATLSLALEGVRPNPASDGELSVHFSLPTAERAWLELMDVNGRRLARQEVEGSGRHIVNLGRGIQLAPGVYVVRLSQGPDVRTAQATVLR